MDIGPVLDLVRLISLFAANLWLAGLGWTYWNGTPRPFWLTLLSVFFAVALNYACAVFGYSENRMNRRPPIGQLPPRYPEVIPFLGNIASFLWDRGSFMRRVGMYRGTPVSTRVSMFGCDIYVFQDRETVARLVRDLNAASPMSLFTFVLSQLFGISRRALAVYSHDDSGPLAKPYTGSNVRPEDRIHHNLRRGFLRSMSGRGLAPTTQRFVQAYRSELDNTCGRHEQRIQLDDFFTQFQRIFTSSMVHAVFGPAFLQLNPDFVDNLIQFDDLIPLLSNGMPALLVPKARRVRVKLRQQLKAWYAYARQAPSGDNSDDGNDLDAGWSDIWGSDLIRFRHSVLSQAGHDEDDISATDLGLIWTAMNSTAPASIMATLHIIKEPGLLERVRDEVNTTIGQRPVGFADVKDLAQSPLLLSIYAETLRLYVKVFFFCTSPQVDLDLGKWRLPRGKIGVLNTEINHMDEGFWNTKNGLHPATEFWAERFLVDPLDPSSGPIKPECRERGSSVKVRDEARGAKKPFFSMEGLEGAWLPYGGGADICPGRFLAKSLILLLCAMLATELDVELLTDSIELDTWRYGFLGKPKQPIPARIRRRHVGPSF